MKFLEILQKAIVCKWSDIHLTTDKNIYYRQNNKLNIWEDEFFTREDFKEVIENTLNETQKMLFRQNKVIDYAYEFNNRRFRINIYMIYKGYGMAIRLINDNVKPIENFYQQKVLQDILHNDNGLILICGATGTGKSTTLASMIEYINQNKSKHIITLEEPIEYVFTNTETMKACLNAAETGHLVLGTLHASSVIEAIMRMESFFNQEQIEAISMQIASSLNSIIIQKLIPIIDENLVCCMDILLASTAVKNLISKNQLSQLISQMQLNRQNGMQFIQDDIEKLVKAKLIDEKIAKKYIG